MACEVMTLGQPRETAVNTAIAETIFIVDDDEAVRDSLQALLESFGLTVEAYRSGLEFLAAGVSGEGGCLLLDLRMSLMSGLYVLEALAKDGISMPVHRWALG